MDKRFNLPQQGGYRVLFIVQRHARGNGPTPQTCSCSTKTPDFDGPVAELTLDPLLAPGAGDITSPLRMIVLDH